jgi:hypothetical protein
MVSLNDFADRPPRVLTDGEVVDLGGAAQQYQATTKADSCAATKRQEQCRINCSSRVGLSRNDPFRTAT